MAVKFKIIAAASYVLALAHLAALASERGRNGLTRVLVEVHQERSTDSKLFARVDAFGSSHDLVLKRIKMPPVEVNRLVSGKSRNDKPFAINETDDIGDTDFFFDEQKGSLLFHNSHKTLEGAVTETLAIRLEEGQHVAKRMNKPSHDFCTEKRVDGLQTDSKKKIRQPGMRNGLSYTVEVSVLVDSTLYGNFDSSSDLVNYLKVYWYLVNRRFKTVSCATINIALKRIQYSSSSSVDSYFMNVSSSTTSDINESIKQMGAFFGDSSQTTFDIVHLMTARDFYRMSGGSKSYSVSGIAYLGMVCSVISGNAYNIGTSEDSGYYDGVLTSAHEIGHNLGAPHDGSSSSSSCSADDGYLMSYVATSYTDFYFSSCSSTAMCDIYDSESAGCLSTTSDSAGISLTSNLAGEDFTLDEQCKYHTGEANAEVDTSVSASQHCYALQCKYIKYPYIYTARPGVPAIEGTYCYPASSGLQCIDGRCQ